MSAHDRCVLQLSGIGPATAHCTVAVSTFCSRCVKCARCSRVLSNGCGFFVCHLFLPFVYLKIIGYSTRKPTGSLHWLNATERVITSFMYFYSTMYLNTKDASLYLKFLTIFNENVSIHFVVYFYKKKATF